jgi:hypothetical protein
MKMVSHQAEQVKPNPILRNTLCKAGIEKTAVPIVPENVLPGIPANGHMINRPRIFNPEWSCHKANTSFVFPSVIKLIRYSKD